MPLRDVHAGPEAPGQYEHDRNGEEAQAHGLRNARQAIRPWRPQLHSAQVLTCLKFPQCYAP